MKKSLPVHLRQEVEEFQGRSQKVSYRSLLDRLTPHQKKYVDEKARAARHKKSLEKLFLALDANNIEVLHREHDLAIRFTQTLEEDGYLTPEQAEEVYGMVECALLDWLKNAKDCSFKFLTEMRRVIARSSSQDDFDAEWTFLEVEFYLRLGMVTQTALDKALEMVMEAGNQAKRIKATHKAETFQILADILASWGGRPAESLQTQNSSVREWVSGKLFANFSDGIWFRNLINEQKRRNSQS